MNTIPYLVAGLVVLALLSGGLCWVMMNKKRPAVIGVGGRASQYAHRDLLTPNELEFIGRLRNALPELQIFPQVALSAIIRPKGNGKATAAARNRIDRKVVDFAVYTPDFALVCIVELDDSTHDAAKDVERDQLTLSANIATHRWNSKAKPCVEEIRNLVFPAARPHAAHPVALHLVQERRKQDKKDVA